eukprot:COSAG06_NODE_6526_length_2893_cov_55.618110_1_plen_100_part_00
MDLTKAALAPIMDLTKAALAPIGGATHDGCGGKARATSQASLTGTLSTVKSFVSPAYPFSLIFYTPVGIPALCPLVHLYFFEFFLCLSRACLGKMSIFI